MFEDKEVEGRLLDELRLFFEVGAPNIGIYEQALYLNLLTRALSQNTDTLTAGLKSERKRFGYGVSDAQRHMSESTTYKKLRSIENLGFVSVEDSNRLGTVIRILLPSAVLQKLANTDEAAPPTIEDVDFFEEPDGRRAILRREGNRCFYCQRQLDELNTVMEHVISRPAGDNSYRNIVASCFSCNNSKGSDDVFDFVRSLLRSDRISEDEFDALTSRIRLLRQGKLLPEMALAGAP